MFKIEYVEFTSHIDRTVKMSVTLDDLEAASTTLRALIAGAAPERDEGGEWYRLRLELYELTRKFQKPASDISPLKQTRLERARKTLAIYGESTDRLEKHSVNDRFAAVRCYVCHERIGTAHKFYTKMCGKCGEVNYEKRFLTRDLKGLVAVVTGARIKIGFEITTKLLRAGARVVATTRFLMDAKLRFQAEPDYKEWKDQLEVYALDLMSSSQITEFIRHVQCTYDRLDILINNAAQTIRRPVEFFRQPYLLDAHPVMVLSSEDQARLLPSPVKTIEVPKWIRDDMSASTQVATTKVIYDEHMQPLDLRSKNTWTSNLDEVAPAEVAETVVINQIAPVLLIQGFTGMMRDTTASTKEAWIINVSSMEGKFTRYKTTFHPHTNMAKAALNMLTHTSASDYARFGIYMNAADTGWVTDELPTKDESYSSLNCPIDEVDGAARVLDPIMTRSHEFGLFLKDYKPTAW
jgi:NAD(P)-dependent dehydrogenase (short-subunit alcohol dehydrogenase family)